MALFQCSPCVHDKIISGLENSNGCCVLSADTCTPTTVQYVVSHFSDSTRTNLNCDVMDYPFITLNTVMTLLFLDRT